MKKKAITASVSLLIFAAVFAVSAFYTRKDAIVWKADGSWMKCSVIALAFNRIVYLGGQSFAAKEEALAAPVSAGIGHLKYPDFVIVEYVLPKDDWADGTKAAQAVFPFPGKYKINASGHVGYLTIGSGEKGLWGTIQFPDWAKGTVEVLKRVRYDGKNVYFLRSATTVQELRKLGAPEYFTQEYTGEFSKDGSYLSGFYLSRGAKYQWKCERIKR